MIRDATEAWDGAWTTSDLRTAERLPRPAGLAGVIVSGSPHHLAERTTWMLRGLAYLRELVAAGTPTLGICFGHQMLGEALGGRVGQNPRGRELGTVHITHHVENPLLEPDTPFTANASHLDSILELPAGAEVFAATEKEPHALVRFSAKTWGAQFHPEMDAEVVADYIYARQRLVEAEGTSTETLLASLHDSHAGRRVLNHFVRRVVRAE